MSEMFGRGIRQGGTLFSNLKVLKMAEDVVNAHTRGSATPNEEGWMGFVCKECGAPLAVHQATPGSKPGERSSRGWRVACTGCGVTAYYELGTPMVRITATA